MNNKIALCLLVAAPLSAPAAAAPQQDSEWQTVVATRTTNEVRSLENETRFSPSDGGAYIELASAYHRAGLMPQAAQAYTRALALDNVMLETRSGDAVWSHQVARDALGTSH